MNNSPPSVRKHSAFSLVELLTVIFIISLLIAILVPSLGAARNAAKKASSKQAMKSIDVGLEMFKNEQGKDFAQTNGYPPSFSHPPIPEAQPAFGSAEAAAGKFPFRDGYPVAFGAQWLPAMLMGVDAQGYVSRRAVPTESRKDPAKWYTADATPEGGISQRASLYLDPGNVRTLRASNLPGRQPTDASSFIPSGDLDKTLELPVIVDAFDQPILYYAANKNGRPTNMVETIHREDNSYSGGVQASGPPFYFHQDNSLFTGAKDKPGWDFGNSGGKHNFSDPGEAYTAVKILQDLKRETFATNIIDRKVYKSFKPAKEGDPLPSENTPLRPVNADSYILVSPGVDGKYGTNDDIANYPEWED